MRKSWFAACIIAVLIWAFRENTALAQAQETAQAAPAARAHSVDFAPELNAITADLKTAFDGGKTNAADLQGHLTAINALIAKHFTDGKREQVARLYLLDAHIYADGLHDRNRAQAIWEQVARDFPGTPAATGARLLLNQMVPEGLEIGQRFPYFNEAGLSPSACLGKVTLIDFWATWCGPCCQEMPNVIDVFQNYHAKGFAIIGVSLDDDQTTLENFIRANKMDWPQYFDGLAWKNKLAVRFGIKSIPANYLLDRHGIIIGKDLRGHQLGTAVSEALAGS